MNNTIWFEPITIEQFSGSSVNMDKALGIEVTEIGDDYIVAKMPVTEKTKQPYGILHGGASCVLAESIGSTAAALSMDQKNIQLGLKSMQIISLHQPKGSCMPRQCLCTLAAQLQFGT